MMMDDWVPLSLRNDTDHNFHAPAEGVPHYLEVPLWDWIKAKIAHNPYGQVIGNERVLNTLRLRLKMSIASNARYSVVRADIENQDRTLDVVDALLSESRDVDATTLEGILRMGGSAWTVGTWEGRRALVRRIPEGVQVSANEAFQIDKAGPKLAEAWHELYGVAPNPEHAYTLAVKAVEHAVLPQVMPNDRTAILSKAIGQMRRDGDWALRVTKEPDKMMTGDVVIGMLETLWKGHSDRHGGDTDYSSTPVTEEAAAVALGLSVTLIQWFAGELVFRQRNG